MNLNLSSPVISSFVSRVVILLTHDHTPNETHQGFYAFTGIFYLVALVTSNTALQFISYPSQVIGKGLINTSDDVQIYSDRFLSLPALKPIPTMIFGSLVGGKSYAIHKYFLVLLVVSGAIMFIYKSDQTSNKNSIFGFALVGVSLLMNGCVAGVQEKMRAVCRPSPLNLMMFLNSWSSIFAIVGVIASREVESFVKFCSAHPEVLAQLTLILVVGGFGQYFVCTMITNYGVVPCCIVLTLRKFFNVLFSVLYFGHDLSITQWLATALIFASLMADSILSIKFPRCDKKVSDCVVQIDSKEKQKSESDEETMKRPKEDKETALYV